MRATGGLFSAAVAVMFSAADAACAQAVPAAHWRMDEEAGAVTLLPAVGTNSIALKNGAAAGVPAVDGTGVSMAGGAGQIVDSKTLIPATGDFGVFLWIAFTNIPDQTAQMHLLSCNTGQVNRANFMVIDGRDKLGWFHNGGLGCTGETPVNDGAWHHVGFTRRGGVGQLWVDGKPDGNPSGVSVAPISQAQDWRVGSFVSETSGLFAGRIDDLRVYTNTLDDADVAALAASYVPAQAEHRWRLDEDAGGTVFAPESGWMAAVARKAPQTGVRAPQGTGIGLDGANLLRIPCSRFLVPATNDFSVFLWMRDDAAAPATLQLLSNNAGSSQSNRCSFGLNFNTGAASGKLFFFHPDATLVGNAALRDSGWHHVGLVRRGNAVELWVDGDLDASRDYGEGFALSQEQDWRVGAGATESVNFLTGRLDDLRIYTNALDAAGIAALYESYTPADSLVAHWTFNDAPNKRILEPAVGWREIQALNALQSGAAGADGTGLWANSISRGRILGSRKLIPATNDFTVLLWMRTTASSTPEKHLFTDNRGQAGRCNLTYDASNANKLTWWANNANGLVSVGAGSGPVIDNGAWHQVGISRHGKTFRLWVDGVNVSSATSAHVNPAMSQSNDWFIASNASDAGAAFYGNVGTGYALMDDLRVYSRGLEAAEVAALYNAFTPLPSGAPSAPETDHSAVEAATGGKVVGHLAAIFGESDFHLPSLIVCGDGSYLVSATVLNSSLGVHAKIFRSADGGASWTSLGAVAPLYGGTLFERGGLLYLLGNSADGGALVIRRSVDGGATWTAPGSAASGILTPGTGWHFRAGAVTFHGGRVWVYAERRGNTARGAYPANVEAGALSAPADADLLDAANWTVTDPLTTIPEGWNTAANFTGWTSGRTVIGKDGALRMAMQVTALGGAECLALLTEGAAPGAGLTHVSFADVALLPGGANAFAMRYDPASRRFWAVTNPDGVARAGLFSSFTLRDWAFHALALEAQDATQTFSVPDFQFDGNDLIGVYRTAYPDQDGAPASRNHLLFKRVANFREFQPDKQPGRLLAADSGNGCVRRYSFGAQHNWLFDDGADPLFAKGSYAGQPLTAPYGLALADGRVYVGERVAGGRVLAFTPRGAFQGVAWAPGAGVTPGALAAEGGSLYVADEAGNRVWRVDRATGAAAVWLPQSGTGYALQELRGLACDGAGNLYAADRTADLILRFNAAGEFVGSVTQDAAEALLWDAEAGRLLATVYQTPDIVSVDPATWTVTKMLDNNTGNQRFLGLAKAGGRLYFTSDAQNRVNRQDGPSSYRAADIRVSAPGHLLLVPQGGEVYPEAALGTVFIAK